MNYIITTNTSEELYHHGIMGQRWGIRRFQNEDGSLTEAGKKRYGNVHESSTYINKYGEKIKYDSTNKQKDYNKFGAKGEKRIEKRLDSGEYRTYQEARKPEEKRQTKKMLAIGITSTTLAILSPVLVADLMYGSDSVIIKNGKKAVKAGQKFVNKIEKNIAAKKFINDVFSDDNMDFDDIVDATDYLMKNYLK